MQKIENCRDVHDFTQKNFEKDLKPEFTDLDSIKVWIDRLNNWEKIITSNIRTQYMQGFINIIGKGLRETLSSKVKKEQSNIKGYLYDLTNQKAKEITNALGTIKNTLGRPAQTLQTFVDYVNSLKMCKNQKDNLVDEKKRLEEMNMTLKKFRSKEDQNFTSLLSVLQSKIDEIQTGISDIEALLQASEGTVTESKDAYAAEVENKIAEEREKVNQHIEKLSGDQLMSSSTDPIDAQKLLNKIKNEFDQSVARL